ncbi:putative bifunctional diguanylate cyclase/phosphodiesterase [Pengzhenrongella frigida]|uniref:Bifunctional diguanylate cyclase/phosphodiesterase n=1 Tax=Pengzhenrongella frigida TaxID=1259133 RepID=A0A4Q5N120_9MICO|nr:bifunctional diguanylate cyclase/phosphodiesterase [Cellulomonas sp. HLT2-17]RYV50217.1 bifunctional diguanylate cyclase/phosphodiesterase [Cellulomonas sp. HLT2-17]
MGLPMTTWRRYVLAGLPAAVACALLPIGIGRDLVYCSIAATGTVAIIVGVRRHRPDRAIAWYLMAFGIASWVAGDGLYSWYEHVVAVAPFPSWADVLYLAAYPLFAAGLLILLRSKGPERWPTAVLDSAILTVALGLLSWVFLIEPTWAVNGTPLVERLIAVAYPIADGLLFAILIRLAMGAKLAQHNPALRLLAASVAALVAADILFELSTFVPVIAENDTAIDPIWLAAYVLWGAAALHPAMRTLSSPSTDRASVADGNPLIAFAAALLIGPAILLGEVLAAARPHVGAVVCASGFMVPLVLVRMTRLVHLLTNQTRRLGELADTDFVTGLANRRKFADAVGEHLATGADRAAAPTAGLLLIDLERFTEIEETLGHLTGDAILRAVGARLAALAGANALIARLSGDSFGVLDCSITSATSAVEAAARIRSGLELPLELIELSVSVEVSVGVVLLPDDGSETAVVLRRADVALSAAKERPGRTARYGVEMETGGNLAPSLIGELRGALDRGEIVLHYQPQVEVRTGRVLGVEALARWQHPEHGLLGPDSFIAAAERTGIIGPLTQYVLDRALAQCAIWRRAGLPLTVAVNLSVRNLLDPGLVDDVRAALSRHGLEANVLELEITEGTAMVDPRRSLQVLGTLADMGVLLSIDDYGTGHSSLAYLQRLPVRRLKIDRSFVTGLVDDEPSAAIVRSTIELARHLGLDVVAEGVEDDVTLLRLHAMACFAVQGFGLGRPVPPLLLPDLVDQIEARVPDVVRGLGVVDMAAGTARAVQSRPSQVLRA